MDPSKRERLEAAGWKVGSVDEFLGLSDEESLFVELKLALDRGRGAAGDQRRRNPGSRN